MVQNKWPIAVAILAFLYLVVGVVGVVHHFPELHGITGIQFDDIWIETTELLAILCGIFLLRAANWARWLAVAWIAFHVIISALDAFHGFFIHCLLCAVIIWMLFRPESTQYFRKNTISGSNL